jgi:hypothetical protein
MTRSFYITRLNQYTYTYKTGNNDDDNNNNNLPEQLSRCSDRLRVERSRFECCQEKFFSSLQVPDQLSSPYIQLVQEIFFMDVKLTTDIYQIPRSKFVEIYSLFPTYVFMA